MSEQAGGRDRPETGQPHRTYRFPGGSTHQPPPTTTAYGGLYHPTQPAPTPNTLSAAELDDVMRTIPVEQFTVPCTDTGMFLSDDEGSPPHASHPPSFASHPSQNHPPPSAHVSYQPPHHHGHQQLPSGQIGQAQMYHPQMHHQTMIVDERGQLVPVSFGNPPFVQDPQTQQQQQQQPRPTFKRITKDELAKFDLKPFGPRLPLPTTPRKKPGLPHRAVSLDPEATPKVPTPAKRAISIEPIDPFTFMGSPPIRPTASRILGSGALHRVDEGGLNEKVSKEVSRKVDKGKGKQKSVPEEEDNAMDVDEEEGEEEEEADDLDSWSTNNPDDVRRQIGRIPKAQWEVIRGIAKEVLDKLKEGAAKIGRSQDILIHEVNKSLKVKMASHLTSWNFYTGFWWANKEEEQYRLGYKIPAPTKASFAKFQEQVPEWEDYLVTWWTLRQKTQGTDQQVADRESEFQKYMADMFSLASAMDDRGFPTIIAACGTIVHQDQGIGATRVSRPLEELLPFLDLTEDSLLGDMKSHSYTYVAKANQDSRRSKRSTKGKAKAKDDGQTSADDDDEDDDEEEEEDDDDDSTLASSSGNADDDEFLAQVAALKDEKLTKAVRKSQSAAAGIMKMEYQPLRPLIKAFLAARLRLAGASWQLDSYLTWNKIAENMATAGVAIEEWPVGLVFLGQIHPKAIDGKKRGLKDFGIDVARRIALALRSGDLRIIRHDPAKLQNNKVPVSQEAAPPSGHEQKAARRMFADRTVDHNGPKRLKGPSTSKGSARSNAANTSASTSSKTAASSSSATAVPSSSATAAPSSSAAAASSSAAAASSSAAAASSSAKAKAAGKPRIVLDSDDDAPLAPKPKSQLPANSNDSSDKVEKIPVTRGPAVHFVDDISDKVEKIPVARGPAVHFVDDSEDEAYSPSVLASPSPFPKRRQSKLTVETDEEDEEELPEPEDTPKPKPRTRQAAKKASTSKAAPKTTSKAAPKTTSKATSKATSSKATSSKATSSKAASSSTTTSTAPDDAKKKSKPAPRPRGAGSQKVDFYSDDNFMTDRGRKRKSGGLSPPPAVEEEEQPSKDKRVRVQSPPAPAPQRVTFAPTPLQSAQHPTPAPTYLPVPSFQQHGMPAQQYQGMNLHVAGPVASASTPVPSFQGGSAPSTFPPGTVFMRGWDSNTGEYFLIPVHPQEQGNGTSSASGSGPA